MSYKENTLHYRSARFNFEHYERKNVPPTMKVKDILEKYRPDKYQLVKLVSYDGKIIRRFGTERKEA